MRNGALRFWPRVRSQTGHRPLKWRSGPGNGVIRPRFMLKQGIGERVFEKGPSNSQRPFDERLPLESGASDLTEDWFQLRESEHPSGGASPVVSSSGGRQ